MKGKKKVEKVMKEFGKGELHSGSKKGPKVTNPKQAIAIALSEAGMSKPSKSGNLQKHNWQKKYKSAVKKNY